MTWLGGQVGRQEPWHAVHLAGGAMTDVWLGSEARVIATGELNPEGWRD